MESGRGLPKLSIINLTIEFNGPAPMAIDNTQLANLRFSHRHAILKGSKSIILCNDDV